jgi:hypothetical protein
MFSAFAPLLYTYVQVWAMLQNDNITDGDAGTVAVIPSFIDSVKDELDAITFDSANNVATTDQDVTALIVQNKTSDAVVPFN